MKKVFLAIGHGGKDSGALGLGNGYIEKALNLSIGLYVREYLLKYDVDALMSRTSDEDDPVSEEVKESNTYNPDVSVAIHINSASNPEADGFEAYYHFGGGLSKELAENIEKEVIKLGQNSRGCKIKLGDDGRDWYYYIRETKNPAAIIECAFISNAEDIKIIDTQEEQRAMAWAIAKGILKTLNVEFEEKKTMGKFKDVPDTHWAYEAIEKLADIGIISGYGDKTFKPSGLLTRAEVCVMLANASKKYDDNIKYILAFEDVKPGSWYENKVNFCTQRGYIKGYPDGTFKPDKNITRAEFAVMLVRFMEGEKE